MIPCEHMCDCSSKRERERERERESKRASESTDCKSVCSLGVHQQQAGIPLTNDATLVLCCLNNKTIALSSAPFSELQKAIQFSAGSAISARD